MSFKLHPSKELKDIYKRNPHQGADPLKANIIFVGRDPNWNEGIEDTNHFKIIKEYLEDGVSFWKKYRVHHPFLLNEYRGDGKRYHSMFAKIGLDKNYAEEITFIELIGLPTVGMSKKRPKLFKEILFSKENQKHLLKIDSILNNESKLIFLAWGLLTDIKLINSKTGLFKKIASIDKTTLDIKTFNKINNIHIHKHFSDSISNETIAKIRNAIISIV